MLGLLAGLRGSAQPVINEVLSLNETGIVDGDGDRNDWIELYNPDPAPVNLSGYTLTDDSDDIVKWTFPDVVIEGHGYLLIYASGKDRYESGELHTNFKITSDGEWIYLEDPEDLPVDQVAVPPLNQDKSFGRYPDGGEWSHLDTPTPGGTNNGSNHLTASHESGFYAEALLLTISSLNGDSVYYTLNGSEPDSNSPPFTGNLFVADRSEEPNTLSEIPTTVDQDIIYYWPAWQPAQSKVAKSTVVRFASFHNGVRTSDVYTKVYFVGSTFDRYTMPVVSVVTDPAYLFDEQVGIYVPGVHFNPNHPNHPELTGNFFQRGKEWEREVHLTYFNEAGIPVLSQNAGIRIHGNTSRQAAQKSLRLYARKEYGTQYFEYPLLPNKYVTQFKRFLLRAVMGSWEGETLFTDDFAQTSASGMGIEYQDSRPVIVFLNGEYWGIHVIKDRIDEHFISYSAHLDPDSVLIADGYTDPYYMLTEFARDHDLSETANYDSLANLMDIDNFIDYHIAQQFFRNIDWPGNNIQIWKPLTGESRFRWIYYDLDVAFGSPYYNMLEHCTLNDPSITYPNPPVSTQLFRGLIENEIFKNKFLARYAEALLGVFDKEKLLDTYARIKADYTPEVPEHMARWNYPRSMDVWLSDIDALRSFVERRPCIVAKQIQEFFPNSHFPFFCRDIPGQWNQTILIAPNPNQGEFTI
ncbi:MAG TPA: CotH kinase family protein, partial [Cryomorphaceae bacterium]|nr:CotH kinase family protein [Cryomorphaceae bacterium]